MLLLLKNAVRNSAAYYLKVNGILLPENCSLKFWCVSQHGASYGIGKCDNVLEENTSATFIIASKQPNGRTDRQTDRQRKHCYLYTLL